MGALGYFLEVAATLIHSTMPWKHCASTMLSNVDLHSIAADPQPVDINIYNWRPQRVQGQSTLMDLLLITLGFMHHLEIGGLNHI